VDETLENPLLKSDQSETNKAERTLHEVAKIEEKDKQENSEPRLANAGLYLYFFKLTNEYFMKALKTFSA